LDPDLPDRKFIYTATTNKAAEVLRGTVNQETHTIHSLLGLRVINDYKTGQQSLKYGTTKKVLDHSIIFIDEASMINDELATAIRDTAKKAEDCKIVFIGDKYQLPPVKEDICSIFRPPMQNMHELKEIHRQLEGSPIIALANEYRDLLDNPSETWPKLPEGDETIIRYDDPTSYKNAIRERYSVPHKPDDFRIVAWSNKRVNQYNNFIHKDVLGYHEPYAIGDQVTTNKPLFIHGTIAAPTDFRMEVTGAIQGTDEIEGHELKGWWVYLDHRSRVFQPNSWEEAKKLSKLFATAKNWPAYFAVKERWADLRPIHASTVHKAQGSTYREVFIDLEDMGRNTRWRDLVRVLYVAVTRASHKVHIYGKISVKHTVYSAEDSMEAFQNVFDLLRPV
jgi:hypothetical protein